MERLERIAERLGDATGYDVEALRMRRRDMYRVAARQLFCYYARAEGYSYGRIGAFVRISHSSAIHGVKRIESLKEIDSIVKDYIRRYEVMSKRRQMYEVCPPDYNWPEEEDTLKGFCCPLCNGRGFHLDHGARETQKVTCGRCSGTGRLKARVMIRWEADLNN